MRLTQSRDNEEKENEWTEVMLFQKKKDQNKERREKAEQLIKGMRQQGWREGHERDIKWHKTYTLEETSALLFIHTSIFYVIFLASVPKLHRFWGAGGLEKERAGSILLLGDLLCLFFSSCTAGHIFIEITCDSGWYFFRNVDIWFKIVKKL